MQAWMRSCQICARNPRLPFEMLAEIEEAASGQPRPLRRAEARCVGLKQGSSAPFIDNFVVYVGIEWIAAHYPVEWALAVMDDPVTEPCGEAGP